MWYKNGKWSCSCFYFEKIHLPCPHLLKVIDRLEPYIGDYWRKNEKLVGISKDSEPRKLKQRTLEYYD
jgi:hypothetical protein